MTLEWLIVALLVAGALFPIGRRLGTVKAWVALLVLYSAALGACALWHGSLQRRQLSRAGLEKKTPRQDRPGGYVSSDSCRSCHPDQYATWHRSYHRTMTQLPSAESVRGNFDGVELESATGEKYELERSGDEFWATMVDPDWKHELASLRRSGRITTTHPQDGPRTRKRISLLTGSHHMQAYWVASDNGNKQYSFPFTYLFDEERWVPRDDVFLRDRRLRTEAQIWNQNCANCHATAGQPRQDPHTKILDTRTAELGIACEACHGPAEQHLRANLDPKRRYTLHRAGGQDPSIFNPARENHLKAADACGQCHAIRSRNPHEDWNMEGCLYRPGGNLEANAPLIRYDPTDLNVPGMEIKRAVMEGSYWSDGQVRVSGREFNGLVNSPCYTRGEMSCLSCHSMHKYQDTDDQLAAGMEGNRACLQCHGSMAAKLEQHTHHRAASSGSLCYNCHMPHTTYGLLKAIRSHTIDSPSVQSSLATGRPNACNLCHLDQTLEWTGLKLNEWYQQPVPQLTQEQKSISAAVNWLLAGDAGQRALIAWHMGWAPAKQTSGEGWPAPFLAELLADPYAAVRYIAKRSLKGLPGFEQFTYDYIAPPSDRARGRQRALDTWRKQPRLTGVPGEAVLMDAGGQLREQKKADLLQRRDDRAMDLLE